MAKHIKPLYISRIMNNISENIIALGFDTWFQDNIAPENRAGFDIARVIAVHKDSCIVTNGEKDVYAELIGKLMYTADSPLDYPAVGDWVSAQFLDDDTFSIIHEILPRKSVLKRKTPGRKIDFQLIATNIDTAFIMQSLDANFNPRRLERYLVMIHESRISPVILLSKSDLMTEDVIETRISEIRKTMPAIPTCPFSNESGVGLDTVRGLLEPGKTYCLLGSSGVGKTTLLNNLIGETVFKTRAVREKDSKGRHATTGRQLIRLAGGAMIIDTPGMRELGNFEVETGLDETFADIIGLAGQCRFNDCTHSNEKGCAVLLAVENGELSEKRLENYFKMTRESAYLEMSYHEKRQKDKEFGKFVKSILKHGKKKGGGNFA